MREFLPDWGRYLKYTLLLCFTMVCAYAQAQQTVSGTVKDKETGEVVPGVTVTIKGTNNGTSTDGSGRYSLEVPSSEAVIVFSFIGYAKQEITVGSQSTIDIILLPDLSTLEEIVVVGYGEMKKSVVTGSYLQSKQPKFGKRSKRAD